MSDILNSIMPKTTPHSVSLREGEFWALRDLSLELAEGEALGVIGRNGSGKTTLLRVIQGLTPPDRGKVSRHVNTAALIDIGAGFEPLASGRREAIWIEGTLLGLGADEIIEIEHDIIDFAELRGRHRRPAQYLQHWNAAPSGVCDHRPPRTGPVADQRGSRSG